MSKPKLSVELTEPDRIFRGGDTVTGVVRVDVDKDIACNGLVIQIGWRTHGRGNVTSKIGDSVTAFQGQWQEGESLEYPFELKALDWPPTYHGHFLNVDHYVDARAKIAWSFDPKASAAFQMVPLQAPADSSAAKANSLPAKVFVALILMVAMVAVFAGFAGVVLGLGWIGLPFFLLPIGGIGFWFLKNWLPKYLLGNVECELSDSLIVPGGSLTGELVLKPRRSVGINGINVKLEGREQVVSGSGSNKTTHRHVFFEQEETLREAGKLMPGTELRLPIAMEVPSNAPLSLNLAANELIWTVVVRIDIPRWPDWVKTMVFQVVPSGESVTSDAANLAMPKAGTESSSGITFEESVNHLWQVRADRDQRDMLVDAIAGLTFSVTAIIERRLLYGGDHDANVYPQGHSVWARFPNPELPLVLFVPHDMGEEFEQLGRQQWTGQATVVGWDDDHGRLQLAVES
ncbi:hypothetical protein LF1_33420 [Rubripirellula obstinata]|uniref:Arrestin-like N-terminal domain-containing protein n=1 Tax=Rubripirellula obstinata TaxID=406547 RepID=A0A5B1CML8_9BACT|nr:sporulation protein [Rubripirellula obstinata]KAA1260800.1 hypothetical protein LF1_33420 [Rubripirellula obstinata]